MTTASLKEEIIRHINSIDDEQQLKMLSAIIEQLPMINETSEDLTPDEIASILKADQEIEAGTIHTESWHAHLNRLRTEISHSKNKAG
ncbi:MAG: hypothetical protein IM638_02385 [Bacteroidetes bacterium]|nr:hypothetical protein [Bacteroidota bacterium]